MQAAVESGSLLHLAIYGAGRASSRDVSHLDEYKPWIGKEVRLSGPRSYNIFAPTWGPYLLSWTDDCLDYPIAAKTPPNYPVTIKAVRRMEGVNVLNFLSYSEDQLVLSVSPPDADGEQFLVLSELSAVEPFAV